MGVPVALLVGIGLVFAVFIGLNLIMSRLSKRMEGQPVPSLEADAAKIASDEKPSLFYFHSPHCGPCKAMTPHLKAMKAANQPVVIVDVSRDMETAQKFGVMGTPTVMRVRGGQVEKVLMGAQSAAALQALLAA